MKLPDWWTEMGWDFRLCVIFLIVYTPLAILWAVQP